MFVIRFKCQGGADGPRGAKKFQGHELSCCLLLAPMGPLPAELLHNNALNFIRNLCWRCRKICVQIGFLKAYILFFLPGQWKVL